MVAVRIIGPGRAGTSLALALTNRGWEVAPMLGRGDTLTHAARDVPLLFIATPDTVIPEIAALVEPVESTVVAHLSGSLGLDVLAPHPRTAALHPLVSLPNPDRGSKRLVGAWFAVAGDPLVRDVAEALYGRAFTVADEHRAAYHAGASIAANHLVALLGQVERIAELAGVPREAYFDLARETMENVADLGASEALTGPVARGDEATIRRHVRALPRDERRAYNAMVAAARRLLEKPPPPKDRPEPEPEIDTP
jgi:predicted short-subunit dehydrogenase-like oxidoreductase (DUF2520 family)